MAVLPGKRRIQDTGGWGEKCVLYRSCNRNKHVYFWLPFSNATLEVRDKRFSQDTKVHSSHVLQHSTHLLTLCDPQTVTNELLIELGRNKASGWKMPKAKQGLTREVKSKGEEENGAAEPPKGWDAGKLKIAAEHGNVTTYTLFMPLYDFFLSFFQVYGNQEVMFLVATVSQLPLRF